MGTDLPPTLYSTDSLDKTDISCSIVTEENFSFENCYAKKENYFLAFDRSPTKYSDEDEGEYHDAWLSDAFETIDTPPNDRPPETDSEYEHDECPMDKSAGEVIYLGGEYISNDKEPLLANHIDEYVTDEEDQHSDTDSDDTSAMAIDGESISGLEDSGMNVHDIADESRTPLVPEDCGYKSESDLEASDMQRTVDDYESELLDEIDIELHTSVESIARSYAYENLCFMQDSEDIVPPSGHLDHMSASDSAQLFMGQSLPGKLMFSYHDGLSEISTGRTNGNKLLKRWNNVQKDLHSVSVSAATYSDSLDTEKPKMTTFAIVRQESGVRSADDSTTFTHDESPSITLPTLPCGSSTKTDDTFENISSLLESTRIVKSHSLNNMETEASRNAPLTTWQQVKRVHTPLTSWRQINEMKDFLKTEASICSESGRCRSAPDLVSSDIITETEAENKENIPELRNRSPQKSSSGDETNKRHSFTLFEIFRRSKADSEDNGCRLPSPIYQKWFGSIMANHSQFGHLVNSSIYSSASSTSQNSSGIVAAIGREGSYSFEHDLFHAANSVHNSDSYSSVALTDSKVSNETAENHPGIASLPNFTKLVNALPGGKKTWRDIVSPEPCIVHSDTLLPIMDTNFTKYTGDDKPDKPLRGIEISPESTLVSSPDDIPLTNPFREEIIASLSPKNLSPSQSEGNLSGLDSPDVGLSRLRDIKLMLRVPSSCSDTTNESIQTSATIINAGTVTTGVQTSIEFPSFESDLKSFLLSPGSPPGVGRRFNDNPEKLSKSLMFLNRTLPDLSFLNEMSHSSSEDGHPRRSRSTQPQSLKDINRSHSASGRLERKNNNSEPQKQSNQKEYKSNNITKSEDEKNVHEVKTVNLDDIDGKPKLTRLSNLMNNDPCNESTSSTDSSRHLDILRNSSQPNTRNVDKNINVTNTKTSPEPDHNNSSNSDTSYSSPHQRSSFSSNQTSSGSSGMDGSSDSQTNRPTSRRAHPHCRGNSFQSNSFDDCCIHSPQQDRPYGHHCAPMPWMGFHGYPPYMPPCYHRATSEPRRHQNNRYSYTEGSCRCRKVSDSDFEDGSVAGSPCNHGNCMMLSPPQCSCNGCQDMQRRQNIRRQGERALKSCLSKQGRDKRRHSMPPNFLNINEHEEGEHEDHEGPESNGIVNNSMSSTHSDDSSAPLSWSQDDHSVHRRKKSAESGCQPCFQPGVCNHCYHRQQMAYSHCCVNQYYPQCLYQHGYHHFYPPPMCCHGSFQDTDDDTASVKSKKSVSFSEEVRYHSPYTSPRVSPKKQAQVGHLSPPPVRNDGSRGRSRNDQKSKAGAYYNSDNLTSDSSVDSAFGSESPPREFQVSPPLLTNGYEMQEDSECDEDMQGMKCLVREVTKAVEIITQYFNSQNGEKSKEKLGSTSDCPEVGALLLKHLCPAIFNVISDGLRPKVHSFFGQFKNNVWKLIEESVEQGPSGRRLSDIIQEVKTQIYLGNTSSKFNAFVFGLLNSKTLHHWLRLVHVQDRLLRKHYFQNAFMVTTSSRGQHLFTDLIQSVKPLAVLPFTIECNFEYKVMQNVSLRESLLLKPAFNPKALVKCSNNSSSSSESEVDCLPELPLGTDSRKTDVMQYVQHAKQWIENGSKLSESAMDYLGQKFQQEYAAQPVSGQANNRWSLPPIETMFSLANFFSKSSNQNPNANIEGFAMYLAAVSQQTESVQDGCGFYSTPQASAAVVNNKFNTPLLSDGSETSTPTPTKGLTCEQIIKNNEILSPELYSSHDSDTGEGSRRKISRQLSEQEKVAYRKGVTAYQFQEGQGIVLREKKIIPARPRPNSMVLPGKHGGQEDLLRDDSPKRWSIGASLINVFDKLLLDGAEKQDATPVIGPTPVNPCVPKPDKPVVRPKELSLIKTRPVGISDSLIKKEKKYVQALCYHLARDSEQLSFDKNEVMLVLKELEDNWYFCCHGNKTGLVHGVCMKEIPEEEAILFLQSQSGESLHASSHSHKHSSESSTSPDNSPNQ